MDKADRDALAEGVRAGSRYALGLPPHAPLGSAGTKLGQRAGSSLDFKDYREYQPGDDLRHVDWNAYARSDQLSVKLFREEVNPHLDLLLDVSRSMALEGTAKGKAALALAAFFATAAGNAGYSHRAWTLADQVRPVSNGTARPEEWHALRLDFAGEPAAAFRHAPPAWRPRGVRVLVSDLLWPCDPLTILTPFADQAAAAVVVQLLAEAEVRPPDRGGLRLMDVENDQMRELVVDAAAVRRYQESLTRHQQHWYQACRQVGAVLTVVEAETLLRDWRLEELVAAEVLKVV